MTNATRFAILGAANAIMLAIAAFGVELSGKQIGAVGLAINGVLGVWGALTYHKSPYREIDPDDVPVNDPEA